MTAPASISVYSAPLLAANSTAFSAPLVAKVTDANGNPVSGVTVTFQPQGQGAYCTFPAGNTAVTDVNGLATSNLPTAGPSAGSYLVQAWVTSVNPAVGPAIFTLSNYNPGPNSPTTWAAIQAAWTTAKVQLATVQADAATLASDLTALEVTCDTLYGLGAGDVVDWLRTQARQSRLGYLPRISAGGNIAPQLVAIQAPDASHARDLTTVDQRPITATSTGSRVGLS